MNSSGRNSRGSRRIISAASGSQLRDSQRGVDSPAMGSRARDQTFFEGSNQEEFKREALPDINSARQSQNQSKRSITSPSDQLRQGKQISTPKGSDSARGNSSKQMRGSLKSYQLAGQFQAEEIIDGTHPRPRRIDSQGQGLGGDVPQSPAHLHQPPIDFHHGAGNQSQISHHSNSSRQRQLGVQNSNRMGVVSSNSSHRGSVRVPGSSRRNTEQVKPKKVNAWESFEVNQFKVRNQEPGSIIEKLKLLTAHDIPFMGELPMADDLDSTDPLDSLMCAFVKITNDCATDFTDEIKKGIHLATGTRTEFCEAMLTFVCHHQKLEQAFRDSVDFFMDSLTSVVKLEEENKSMQQNISHLLNLKEDAILVKFNLEKRLKEQIANVDKVTDKERQAQVKISQLQKQLHDKNAECDSLQYRLKHFEEISNMLDPPPELPSGASGGGGAVPNPADDESRPHTQDQPTSHHNQFVQLSDLSKFKDLQIANKRLEEELSQMKEAFAVKDNSEHFRKIQELFNKIQIENKNLRIYNQKCESKLESKQNLINHLEGKVTSVMVEKEEVIIKLKSEIVLLKNKLELNEEKFQQKLDIQNKKLDYEFRSKYSEQIKDLEGQVNELEKQKKDLRRRLTKIHKEHDELSQEFGRFRREKEDQEASRDKQFKSLEDKISSLQQVDDEKISQLNKQIEDLENQNEVIKKENNILLLRQKYLKHQTETLAKQKVFLFETLTKGKSEILENLSKMEKAMMADNNNQAYLVSVEKCIKQAKKMADMGTAALQNISQILQFLKIEKLHSLLSDEEELDQLEKNVIKSMQEDLDAPKTPYDQPQQTRPSNQRTPNVKTEGDATAHGNAMMIQNFLNKHGMGDSSPVSAWSPAAQTFTGAVDDQSKQVSGSYPSHRPMAERNEEYYLNNCPLELASVSVKSLVDVLIQVGKCKSIDDIPDQISTLLKWCNRKSDLTVENEIQSRFLSKTKDSIDQEISFLRANQGVLRTEDSRHRSITEEDRQILQEQVINPSSVEIPKAESNQPSEAQTPGRKSSHNNIDAERAAALADQLALEQQKKINVQIQAQVDSLKADLAKLTVTLEDQRIKSKNLQLNLAGKIVVLEEQIEQSQLQKEDQIKSLEKTHQDEIAVITSGIDQREQQLLALCDEFREEIRDLQQKLETSWKPAEESKTIQKMEKGTRGNLYRLMKDEYETLFKKNNDLMQTYQASINEFVYLREDLRGSFTLAFECQKLGDGLLNLLNESMLKYYLSKTFGLHKSKFRFLRSEQLSEKDTKHILKIIIEVVAEDQNRVAHLFKEVKAQIKDGTSLLYDFMPLYFGMNLGSSGFSTHHNLKDFSLLAKTGQVIDGEEYVVCVMRNKLKPLIFKIIAFQLELREEYMMELSESDIYELVEGDQQILKNVEPDELIQKITSNLNLIVRDKIKVLTCEQKIFFNEIWMQNMQSGKNQQVHVRSMLESEMIADAGVREQLVNPVQSALTHTAVRTMQLSKLQQRGDYTPHDYMKKFSHSIASQTDYEISNLYEGFENVYRGVQKVGDHTHMRLQIQESTKTSTLVFTFDDLTTSKKFKFSLYEKQTDDQYIIHSECMKITEGHHMLVTVEQIQQQGLLVRMHDLLEAKSVSLCLLRKSNGQFTRLPDENQVDVLMKEDFRNFVYELTFVVNKQANENLIQTMGYLFEDETQKRLRKQSDGSEQQRMAVARESLRKEATTQSKMSLPPPARALPKRKRAQGALRIYSFSQRAFYKDKWSYLTGMTTETGSNALASSVHQFSKQSTYMDQQSEGHLISDWRDQPGEKGTLIFRDIFTVRCVFNGGEETPSDSVITFYLKDQQVNIEVTLYKDPSKMSIASSILSNDLFGEDPSQLTFKERVQMLNNMMERLFIFTENSVYHMKVESEAMTIGAFLEAKRKEALLKNPKDKAQEYDVILTAQKIRGIQDEKQQYLTTGKAIHYRRFADIDGEVHTVDMLFIKKTRVRTERSGGRHGHKRFSTYGKSQVEIAQIQIEQFLEEQCDWDSIYFEIIDQNKEMIYALYDKKKLSMMLSKDEFFDWKSAMSSVDPLLLDYIRRSIKVDKAKNEVSLHNKDNVEQNILQKARKVIGGRYLMRQDLELNADEKKVVQKVLLCNMEVELSEFIYDIKIYQMQKQTDRDVISYQIELFALNDPEVVYSYNYPMNFSADVNDPHTVICDVVNLIEHPFKDYPQSKKNKLQSKNSSIVVQENRPTTNSINGTKMGSKEGGVGSPVNSGSGTLEQQEDTRSPSQQRAQNSKAIFQSLFRKYIDNRILLFIQESRFPRKLDMILVEPCSQLQWRYSIEPRQITTGINSLHLVDHATLEMLVAVLIDENENCDSQDRRIFEHFNERGEDNYDFPVLKFSDNWTNIKEVNKNAFFVIDQELIEDYLALSIVKRKNAFCVTLKKPHADIGAELNEEIEGDAPITFDRQIIRDEGLEFRISPEGGDTQMIKVIRSRGLNYSLLFLKVAGNETTIKIIELTPVGISTIFKFVFTDERGVAAEQDSDDERLRNIKTGQSQIFTAKDLQISTLDSYRRYYGAQAIEQGMRMFDEQRLKIERQNDEEYEEPTILEKMEEDPKSIHAERLITKYKDSLESKTIGLYRKTFYDEPFEKLIVMEVSLKYPQDKLIDGLFTEEMTQLYVVLREPETNQETEYLTSMDQCLTQEEYSFESDLGSFRSIVHLKRLAKRIIEDRVEIRRISEQTQMQNKTSEDSPIAPEGRQDTFSAVLANQEIETQQQQQANYTFEIVFEKSMGERTAMIDPAASNTLGDAELNELANQNFQLTEETGGGQEGQQQWDPQQQQQQQMQRENFPGSPLYMQQVPAEGMEDPMQQPAAGRGVYMGENQSTIMEEAASNEEDKAEGMTTHKGDESPDVPQMMISGQVSGRSDAIQTIQAESMPQQSPEFKGEYNMI